MTPAEAHAYLEALTPSTMRMGLERIARALERLGHPERSFAAIHVAGTNGKGSVCAILSSILSGRVRTGFYSSPHLVRVNERFKVNGVDVDDETLAKRVGELLERLGRDHELTYFEFGTALAFWHFQQERVELAVIETGLGGRLDATVLCAPVVTAITSISFDHQEFLGATLPAIAAEKAGIAKPGVPLIVARAVPEVLSVFRSTKASALVIEGSQLSFDGRRFVGVKRTIDGLSVPLRGEHQLQNAAIALGCLEQLPIELSDEVIRQGLAAARWPGRLELLPGRPSLLLDGAHNPAGVDALVEALERSFAGVDLHLVFGVFADKDSEPMMRRLFPKMASVHLTPLHSPRSKGPAELLPLARSLCAAAETCAGVEVAIDRAIAAARPNDVVLAAGSLHLIGEVRALLLSRFEAALGALDGFTPGDDPDETMRRLAELVERGVPAIDPARYRSRVFALLERFPDAEFGTPGALIHPIERDGGFEAELEASLARQPTFLTVSMINRVLNLGPPDRLRWVRALEAASRHPKAPDWVQKAASRYLDAQRDR